MVNESIKAREAVKKERREIPEWPGIVLDGKHVHRDGITMAILERALDEAAPEQQRRIIDLIIAHAKDLELDKLTGLSSLRLIKPKLNKLLERLNFPDDHRESKLESILVVSVDLVGLRYFNEPPYNHAKGDQAIVAFADRLREVLHREGDSACRLHGDEFLLVFPIDHGDDTSEKLYERIKKEINRGLYIEGEKDKIDLLLRANFGHTVARKGDSRTAEQLIHDADVAERAAKQVSR